MSYDLLLKNATVIDPSQNLNAIRDVAIQNATITVRIHHREGEFRFHDVRDNLEIGRKNIHPVLTIRAGKVYRPETLREERDETLARAREIRALTSRRFGDLGWTPSGT